MKNIKQATYLCECGAKNIITAPEHEHRETALFYCRTCSKPSHDLCACGYRSPAGSEHAFCQHCGANSDSIRRGVEVINIARLRAELVQVIVAFVCTMYIVQTWLLPFQNRRAEMMARGVNVYDPITSFVPIVLLLCIAPTLLVPLYTLLTGRERAPLSLRALCRALWMGDADYQDHPLTDLARQAHFRAHKQVRRLRRQYPILRRAAGRLLLRAIGVRAAIADSGIATETTTVRKEGGPQH